MKLFEWINKIFKKNSDYLPFNRDVWQANTNMVTRKLSEEENKKIHEKIKSRMEK